MADPSDITNFNNLVRDLNTSCNGNCIVIVPSSEADKNEWVQVTLDNVFTTIISVTMFLCLFSLIGSTSSNLYSFKQEIGVLRTLGLTKCRVSMLYFYESLILVLSSAILGILIGTALGNTMLL